MAGTAEAVTDPPATLRAHMIADLANFVPAGTNVEAVADVLLYHDFANMHEVMEVELTASDLIELFPFDRFDPDLVVALRVGLAVAAVARGVTPLGTVNHTPPTAPAMDAVVSACGDLARARLLPVFAQPARLPIMLPVAAVEVQPVTPTTKTKGKGVASPAGGSKVRASTPAAVARDGGENIPLQGTGVYGFPICRGRLGLKYNLGWGGPRSHDFAKLRMEWQQVGIERLQI